MIKYAINEKTEQYVYESSRLCFPMEIRTEDRCLMIFTAYIDESGTHADSQDIVLAGYVSTNDQWSGFEDEWKQRLVEYDIPYFHMTDFANRAKYYKSWTDNERNSRLTAFIEVINKYIVCSVGVVLSKTTYAEAMGKAAKGFPGREYGLVAKWFTNLVMVSLLKYYDSNPQIAYVLDWGARHQGTYLRIINGVMKDRRKREALRFLSIRSEDSRIFVPLQAADILAYEVYRFAGSLRGDRKPREPILNMLTKSPNYWFRLSEKDILGLINAETMAKFELVANRANRSKRSSR